MSNTPTVTVRLTQAGKDAAHGGSLQLHGGAKPLTFEAASEQEVSLLVWRELLAPTAPFGKPYFEIVPAASEPAAESSQPSH